MEITLETIRSSKRTAELCAWRYAIIIHLMCAGKSEHEIGRVINRNHSTVNCAKKRALDLLYTKDELMTNAHRNVSTIPGIRDVLFV